MPRFRAHRTPGRHTHWRVARRRHVLLRKGPLLALLAVVGPGVLAGLSDDDPAGITTYSPLRQWGVKKGSKVGVVGLGGLGHMGVKIAAAMGAEVTMLSTSEKKRADSERLGAKHFELTTDKSIFKKLAGSFDLILDTISAPHDYNAQIGLLKPFGTMAIVGAPPEPTPLAAFSLIGGNKKIAGSLIGGIQETQEMLDFCAEHKLVSDIETIAAKDIDNAYNRMMKNDVRYRFVIDVATIEG